MCVLTFPPFMLVTMCLHEHEYLEYGVHVFPCCLAFYVTNTCTSKYVQKFVCVCVCMHAWNIGLCVNVIPREVKKKDIAPASPPTRQCCLAFYILNPLLPIRDEMGRRTCVKDDDWEKAAGEKGLQSLNKVTHKIIENRQITPMKIRTREENTYSQSCFHASHYFQRARG